MLEGMKMYPNIDKVVLASASPRRKELLARLGLAFTIEKPDIDESQRPNEEPIAYAERLAKEKAFAVAAVADTTIISADTIVVLDGDVLGKPASGSEAFAMLSRLSGKSHEVVTAVCLRQASRCALFSVGTSVEFRTVGPAEIEAYVASGCPMDKAGAYAIQGGAAHMVKAIHGSYSNVVGLPLCELHEALVSF